MMHNRPGHMRFMGGMGINLIISILIAVIVILLLVKLIQYLGQPKNNHKTSTTNAKRILDERFARGEIDVEEYNMRRQHLDDNK